MLSSPSQNGERSELWSFIKLAIVFVVSSVWLFLLFKAYPPTQPQTVIRISTPRFSLRSPYNETEYEIEDVYDQLIDLKNFTFLMNPQVCAGYDAGLLLVIIISSKPSHFENRKLIRQTWGKTDDTTKVVFLLGESHDKNLTKLVRQESADYNDIVQGNFDDAYRNLTYKHTMGLKWVSHHCPLARYVLKTDDDLIINSNALRRFLTRELSPWGAEGLITCSVFRRALVQRNNSKWKVLENEYSGRYYPNYCAGYSILYSQDVVQKLLSQVQTLPYFWIDDVHITGVAAQMLNIERTPLTGLILSASGARLLMSLGSEYTSNFLFGPPQLTTDKIEKIWKAIPQ